MLPSNTATPDDVIQLDQMRSELDLLLQLTLSPLEKRVVRLRFGLDDGHPKSLAATGKIVGGKTSSQVRGIVRVRSESGSGSEGRGQR